MAARSIYLDNSATTPPTASVIAAMESAMTTSFGNPSSAHARGEAARRVLQRSRAAVARLLGVAEEAILFTSGATEANNIAILGCASLAPRSARIVTTAVEHSSVLKVCDRLQATGAEIVHLDVDSSGLVDLQGLRETLSSRPALLSVQWVNNETGVIQPIEQIAEIAHAAGVPLHVDAAQAIGKLRLHVAELPIDYMSVTGHKMHGPQGVGALYVRPGRPMLQMLYGGPQEDGRRAGTENVPGIAGFGQAAELRSRSYETVVSHVGELRGSFEQRLLASLPNVAINGSAAPRVAGSTNVLFAGIDGQALVAHLDQEGIYCSQSSACTNQRPEPSYVLCAMGLSENEAYSCVRFTFSELNTRQETSDAAEIVIDTVKKLRRFEGAGVFAA
jgi:cysteine desulfurase